MIPFIDLGLQNEDLRQELRAAVDEVFACGEFILGRFVQQFEERFAAYCGVDHAVAVNSGTSALHLALLAAGVQPGDEVITVPFTFAATAAAIHYCQARPVFIDIDPATLLMDPEKLASAITPRTRAILPVHLYGQPADMDPILDLARRHGLAVVEDAAQAHGAEYHGRRAGSLGDLGCFSFYPTKNLGACGEGGLVTTSNPELARTLRLLRNWGQDRRYHHAMRGYNYRMDGLQGAILAAKLNHLEEWTEARRSVAAHYDAAITNPAIIRPVARPGVRHVYHTYTVRTTSRSALEQRLTAAGIGSAIHYPVPLHLQPAYADPAYPEGSLPRAEAASGEVLSLPVYAGLESAQVAAIAAVVNAA